MNMFIDIECILISSRLSEKLPNPVYMDYHRKEVETVDKSVGC